MHILSTNYINSDGYISCKFAKQADKVRYSQVTDLGAMPHYYPYSSQKHSVNFTGHYIKELSDSERSELKSRVKSRSQICGVCLGELDKYQTDWGLQLADYLMNHKIIENENVRDELINIYRGVSLERNSNKTEYDLKSDCESKMDFADYIVEHSIYSDLKVKGIMGYTLHSMTADTIEDKKILANYLAKNPENIEDFDRLFGALVGDKFVRNIFYGRILENPGEYKNCGPTKNPSQPNNPANVQNTVATGSQVLKQTEKTPLAHGFGRVGGQDKAIEQLKQKILFPMRYPQVYKGRNIDKGIIMFGPPGTGKSLLAQALSEECGCHFEKIAATDMQNKWVGETEKQWQILFDGLIKKQPSILFIDEADALCKARGSIDVYGDKELNKVLQLMSDLKMEDHQVFIILATNNFDALDSAITRDGRFGSHIEVLPPQNIKEVEQIFNIHTKNLKLDISEDEKTEIFTKMLELNCSGSAIEGVVGHAHDAAIKRTGLFEKMENNILSDSDVEKLAITADDINTILAEREMENKRKNIRLGCKL